MLRKLNSFKESRNVGKKVLKKGFSSQWNQLTSSEGWWMFHIARCQCSFKCLGSIILFVYLRKGLIPNTHVKESKHSFTVISQLFVWPLLYSLLYCIAIAMWEKSLFSFVYILALVKSKWGKRKKIQLTKCFMSTHKIQCNKIPHKPV